MKQQTILVNKPRRFGLGYKALLRINEIRYNGGDYIPWSYVREKLCRNFSITKQELYELILTFADLGLLEACSRGIKKNFKVKNG